MIVEDLQGPIYLGQDIFQATHIFHSLTPTHMIMSIGRNTYRTPYIRSRRDRPIARLQPSDGKDQETPSVSINHTEQTTSNCITFTIVETNTLPPQSRTKTRVMFHTPSAPDIKLPCIAELQPVSPAQANYLDVVPTLNQLSTKGHTEIMIANNPVSYTHLTLPTIYSV